MTEILTKVEKYSDTLLQIAEWCVETKQEKAEEFIRESTKYVKEAEAYSTCCLLYTSPSPRDS